jgi:Zn-dependent protease with chaperone function
MPTSTTVSALVTRKERVYFGVIVVVGLAVYGGIIAGLSRMAQPGPIGGALLIYAGFFALIYLVGHGLLIGHLRGNGVYVSERQFPQVLEMARRHCAAIGLDDVPDLFVLQSGGVLNAFATRFVGRDFVVIYSDVLALAEQRGERAVSFVVAHELGHVRRGHLRWRWLTLPGRLVPFLGSAYSRACEYTCDRIGAHCQPDGAVDGLLVLAAGNELYRHVDAHEYVNQIQTQTGFWVEFAEILASHPNLPKRVAALLPHGVSVPSYSPMQGAPVLRP